MSPATSIPGAGEFPVETREATGKLQHSVRMLISEWDLIRWTNSTENCGLIVPDVDVEGSIRFARF